MGFRFYRRVRIAPSLSVNFSRSGPSLSVGVRGAHVTVGRTSVTRTIGLPGTGMFFTSRTGFHTGYHSAGSFTSRRRKNNAPQIGTSSAAIVVAALIALAAFLGWWLAQSAT